MVKDTNELLAEALRWLRSGGRKGDPLTWEEIAQLVGVSMSTISRWAKKEQGVDPTDEASQRRLIWIYHQSKVWYLRMCPFLLLTWQPGGRPGLVPAGVEYKDEDEDLGPATYITGVTFKPETDGIVWCEVTLGKNFKMISLKIHSQYRGLVRLASSRSESDIGGDTIAFIDGYPIPGTKKDYDLKNGKSLEFYLKYNV